MMQKIAFITPSSLAKLQASVFGVVVVLAMLSLTTLSGPRVSPFAVGAWVLVGGVVLSVLAGVRGMWKGAVLGRSSVLHALLVGTLVFVSLQGQILALSLGAEPLVCLFLMGLSFPLSRLGRKVFWGESLSMSVRILILLSFVLLPFLLLPATLNIRGLAANGLFLIGVIIWSVALSITRPQAHNVPYAPLVSWIAICAGVVGLPVLFLFNQAYSGAVSGVQSGLPLDAASLSKLFFFGAVMFSGRFLFLSRSYKNAPASQVSFIWIASTQLFGLLILLFGSWNISRVQAAAALGLFVTLFFLRILIAASDSNEPVLGPTRLQPEREGDDNNEQDGYFNEASGDLAPVVRLF